MRLEGSVSCDTHGIHFCGPSDRDPCCLFYPTSANVLFMTQQRATFSPTFFCLRQDCPDIKLKLSCGWKGKGQRHHALPATDEIEHFVQELHVHYMQSSVTARRMAVLHIILPGQKSFTIKKPWRGGLPKVNQLNRSIKFIDQSR